MQSRITPGLSRVSITTNTAATAAIGRQSDAGVIGDAEDPHTFPFTTLSFTLFSNSSGYLTNDEDETGAELNLISKIVSLSNGIDIGLQAIPVSQQTSIKKWCERIREENSAVLKTSPVANTHLKQYFAQTHNISIHVCFWEPI